MGYAWVDVSRRLVFCWFTFTELMEHFLRRPLQRTTNIVKRRCKVSVMNIAVFGWAFLVLESYEKHLEWLRFPAIQISATFVVQYIADSNYRCSIITASYFTAISLHLSRIIYVSCVSYSRKLFLACHQCSRCGNQELRILQRLDIVRCIRYLEISFLWVRKVN